MSEQYETVNKFDRAYAGLQDGNGLSTKPTTIENVALTGETETFIVQTIRNEKGDHTIIKFVDKEGVKRLILPPRVVNTIVRQRDSLSTRARSNASKAVAQARSDRGELPAFMLQK